MARFAIRNVTKILQSASGRLFGRLTAGDGPGEELTGAQVRSLCSVYSTSEVDTIAAAKLALSGGTLTGHLLFTDNTYDIGANAATRPRTIYVGTSVLAPLFSNPAAAATTLGNATYGVTVPGHLTVGTDSIAKNIYLDNRQGALTWGLYYSYFGTNRVAFDANGTSGEIRIGGLGGSFYPVIYSNGIAALSFTTAGAATLSNTLTMSSSSAGYIKSSTGEIIAGFDLGGFYFGGGLAADNRHITIGNIGSSVTTRVLNKALLVKTTTDDGVNALQVNGSAAISGVVSHGAYTVATLPSAGSNSGKMAQVTDSSVGASGNYGATVAGGGANRVKVFSDGTNWVIA